MKDTFQEVFNKINYFVSFGKTEKHFLRNNKKMILLHHSNPKDFFQEVLNEIDLGLFFKSEKHFLRIRFAIKNSVKIAPSRKELIHIAACKS